MNVFLIVLAWLVLFVVAWPLALAVLLLLPIAMLVAIPFWFGWIVIGAILALVKSLLFLPARILGHRG